MENERGALALLLGLCFLLGIGVAIKVAHFVKHFIKDDRYFKMEMRRAFDEDEYRYWLREFRCHRLCLIPFVTEDNVRGLYRRLYRRPRHAGRETHDKELYSLLIPSLLAAVVTAVCFSGASWAWFVGTQHSEVASVQAARYTVEVSAATVSNGADVAVTPEVGGFRIEGADGDRYRVTLTAHGTASVGYCMVTVGSRTYHTPPIRPEEQFSFEVAGGEATVTPQWGTYAGVADLGANAVLPQAAAPNGVAAEVVTTTTTTKTSLTGAENSAISVTTAETTVASTSKWAVVTSATESRTATEATTGAEVLPGMTVSATLPTTVTETTTATASEQTVTASTDTETDGTFTTTTPCS